MVSDKERSEQILKQVQDAMSKGNAEKAAEILSDMLILAEKKGDIDHATHVKMRLELAALMMRHGQINPREKVTLSLPSDIVRALRLAAAETNEEMSEITANALRVHLKSYPLAASTLRK